MRIRKSRGFTLVELMIVVAIIGVLAALAIYGVRKYLANAKSAEARNSLGSIARSAQAAYSRETAPSELVAPGQNSSAATQSLCSGAIPVPSTGAAGVKGAKYTPTDTPGKDYNTGSGTTGWICLHFEITTGQYYAYNYRGGSTAGSTIPSLSPAPALPSTYATPGTGGFLAEAAGDLNGDGTTSYFAIGGTVDATTKQLYLATGLFEALPDE